MNAYSHTTYVCNLQIYILAYTPINLSPFPCHSLWRRTMLITLTKAAMILQHNLAVHLLQQEIGKKSWRDQGLGMYTTQLSRKHCTRSESWYYMAVIDMFTFPLIYNTKGFQVLLRRCASPKINACQAMYSRHIPRSIWQDRGSEYWRLVD